MIIISYVTGSAKPVTYTNKNLMAFVTQHEKIELILYAHEI